MNCPQFKGSVFDCNNSDCNFYSNGNGFSNCKLVKAASKTDEMINSINFLHSELKKIKKLRF